jgi:hypothetical protein
MKQILAAYALYPDSRQGPACDDLECGNLAALEQEFVPQRPRRAGRMTRMASVGASACLQRYPRAQIPSDRLGLFHGSALGNLRETHEVFRQVVGQPEELPSPIKFSCSLSTASAFFAAQVTQARGPNLLVSQGDFSFEGALLAARSSGELGEVDFALVGATDRTSGNRDEHIAVLGYSTETRLGEGSGWLLLGRDVDGARGELAHVELLPRGGSWVSAVEQRIRELRPVEEPLWVMPGLRVDAEQAEFLIQRFPGARLQSYLGRTGIYPTAAACGLAGLFCGAQEPGFYAHVVKSESGRVALTLFRVLAPSTAHA